MAVYFTLIWFLCVKCQLLTIPPELQHCIFMDYLNLNEQIKCISTLNRDTYKHFTKTHGKEIHYVKQLNAWFHYGTFATHHPQIRQMTHELQLSELFHLHLPQMLTDLYNQWLQLSPIQGSGKQIITTSLQSMNLHSLVFRN